MSQPPYGVPPHGAPHGVPAHGGHVPPAPGTLRCPKCEGSMRTYNRNGIQIEQCDVCRGIFLDFGELESLTRMEGQLTQQVAPPPPAAYPQPGYHAGPAWGHHGGHRYHRGGIGRLFFSS